MSEMNPLKALAIRAISRYQKLKSERWNWDTHWQEIGDYCIPRKDDVYNTKPTGEKKYDKVFDSTAIHTVELLASALHGMLTNPATFFFELTTGDPILDKRDDVRGWFQDVVEKIHTILNNTNFQTEIHEVYMDLVTFGTAPMQIEEDKELKVRFLSHPIYQSYIAENNKGIVDELYRSFKWPLKKIIQEFGEDALEGIDSHKFDKERDANKEFTVVHAVFPRAVYNNKGLPNKFKFASLHILEEHTHVLKESGFRDFPYVVPRWVKVNGEVYGRSPAMKALPDIKMLNAMMLVTIRAAQKVVDPPLMVPNDGVMLPIKTTPGGLNYVDRGGDEIRPLITGGRLDLSYEMMADTRRRIRDAFFVDQLQLQEGPQMTATEVLQRTEEKLRLLGPILGRQQFELLRPMFERIFKILLRNNEFGEPPEILQGQEFQIQYSSQIAKSQRVSESQNLTRAISVIAPLVEYDPAIMDVFDGDEAARIAAEMFNVPQRMLRTQEKLNNIRSARSEAQQQLQERDDLAAQADVVQKLGQVLAEDNKYLDIVKLYKSVFKTQNGEKVLWDLMKASGFTSTNFDENPYKTAFNEGARSMVMRILNLTEMDTDKIQVLMKEQRKADEYERFNING